MTLIAFLFGALSIAGQTYNSNSGGYNTGYGTVYGSFGMATASQNMYNTIQMNMQRAMLQATLKKSGAGSANNSARTGGSNRAATARETPTRVVRNYGRFTADPSVDTAKVLADALGTTAEDKALLRQIYTAVKAEYDKEAATNGWKNNLAGALTFFVVSCSTVFHDSSEPSDDTVAALYDALNQTIDEIPEFGRMTNRDKQGFNNMLIGFSAIPLATYAEGKQNGDAATLKAASDLAGQLIEMILKTDPAKIRFENGSMVFDR